MTSDPQYAELVVSLSKLGEPGKIALENSKQYGDISRRKKFLAYAIKEISDEIIRDHEKRSMWIRTPVSMKQFCMDPSYLNQKSIYKGVLEAAIEIDSDKNITEVIADGSIGCGKTTLGNILVARQVYYLSCMKSPHDQFGIARGQEISIPMQSVRMTTARDVNFKRFINMIDASPYFSSVFSRDVRLKNTCIFPHHIVVRPVSSDDDGAIGENVFSAFLDEMNFRQLINKSKKSIDSGVMDMAWNNYDTISRRQFSRFAKQGVSNGLIFLASSARYPGEFTEKRWEQAEKERKRTGVRKVYRFNKRAWDVAPDKFGKKMVNIFIGDKSRGPRIIEKNEDFNAISEHDKKLTIKVPESTIASFRNDMYGSLRDIAGVSTRSLSPFIVNISALSLSCKENMQSIFMQDRTDMTANMPLDLNYKYIEKMDRNLYRFIHLDLSKSRDSTGLCVCHIERFEQDSVDKESGKKLPVFVVDGALEIVPPIGDEINYQSIREIINRISQSGIPVKKISTDSFQSTDMQQQLRAGKYSTELISVDKTTEPYEALKHAINQGRITMPKHDKLSEELINLEIDMVKRKIDHPPRGSKDVADALAGVVYSLSKSKVAYAQHNRRPSNVNWI